jgi:tRNA A37 threonylcarbamoyladenosine modification protein TsaB
MLEELASGPWLVLDAAGPELYAGIAADGRWLHLAKRREGALEALPAAVQDCLAKTSVRLEDLKGCLYARGPGSTMGLRLACMFIRTLTALPHLGSWKTAGYNTLLVAALHYTQKAGTSKGSYLAPWKRKQLHLLELMSHEPATWKHGEVAPEDAPSQAPLILLGNRTAPEALQGADSLPYPINKVPHCLWTFPEILEDNAEPEPLLVNEQAFAKWHGQRHRKP